MRVEVTKDQHTAKMKELLKKKLISSILPPTTPIPNFMNYSETEIKVISDRYNEVYPVLKKWKAEASIKDLEVNNETN